MKLQPKLLTVFFLTLLITLSTYGNLMPNVTAAEITNQQKGFVVLNNAAVWIDDVYVGAAPVYVQVTEGYHEITVEDPYDWWLLHEFSDSYGNGDSRPVYSDLDITAWYIE
jgi:hypothetical protein